MTLESVLNTPKTFTVNNKEYQVKELSIFELSTVRQSLIVKINKEWMERITTFAQLIPERDRNKFFIEAIRSKPNYEEEIKDALMSQDGVKFVLAKALKVDAIEVEKILESNNNTDDIAQIFAHALGSDKNIEVPEVVQTEAEPIKNA